MTEAHYTSLLREGQALEVSWDIRIDLTNIIPSQGLPTQTHFAQDFYSTWEAYSEHNEFKFRNKVEKLIQKTYARSMCHESQSEVP